MNPVDTSSSKCQAPSMKTYPIFLIGLERERCVVFGGSAEAERKVRGLLECGANVELIAEGITPGLRELADARRIRWQRRDYRSGDLRGARLAIASDPHSPHIAAIHNEAEASRVLLNVMDLSSHCNFVAGSVVRQGELTVAISTSGAAPALAVRLRQRFEALFGPEYAVFLHWMATLRKPLAQLVPEWEPRRRIWYALVDSDLLSLLRSKQWARARRCFEAITGIPAPETDGTGENDAIPSDPPNREYNTVDGVYSD